MGTKRLRENKITSSGKWLLEKRSQIAKTNTVRNGSEDFNLGKTKLNSLTCCVILC
jgi:hypothetical protein